MRKREEHVKHEEIMIESNGRAMMRPADLEDERHAERKRTGLKGGVLWCCSRPSRDRLGSPDIILHTRGLQVSAVNGGAGLCNQMFRCRVPCALIRRAKHRHGWVKNRKGKSGRRDPERFFRPGCSS